MEFLERKGENCYRLEFFGAKEDSGQNERPGLPFLWQVVNYLEGLFVAWESVYVNHILNISSLSSVKKVDILQCYSW